MCGISGALGRVISPEVARAMVESQHHRGPDDNGVFQHPDLPLTLCHNRLSILDTSPAGRQPMTSPDGQVVMVFNGEVYNYRELRSELPAFPYKGSSDSEVVLAAYLEWGEACVERFIGMFAVAIWDGRRKVLFCARDRLGIKPFHYSLDGGGFTFGSEVKAIQASGVRLSPDEKTWAQYLVHGYYDHGPSTFFSGVRVLPAGCTVTVPLDDVAGHRIHRYWDLPKRAEHFVDLGEDEAADHLLTLIDDAVRLRLRSDVPLGVNLSGGLDSASLMTAVDRVSSDQGALETFTASFADPTYDEADWANRVPHERPWTRNIQRLDAAQVFPLSTEAVYHQEAPFGGIATLGYHNLHGLAKEKGVTVLLEGQGVDELLGGYRYFLPHHLLDLKESGSSELLQQEVEALGKDRSAVEAEMARIAQGVERNVYQDGTSHLRPGCVSPGIADLAGEKPEFPAPFSDRLRNVLFRDLTHTKLPRVLRMNDRLSMAFSRELREPYLDHRIVEFAFQLKGSFKIRNGASKWLLRHAMRDRLPAEVGQTPKRAVVTPQREWLQGPLAGQAGALLSSPEFTGRGWFDAGTVAREYQSFTQIGGDNTFFVWQWINTELWLQEWG